MEMLCNEFGGYAKFKNLYTAGETEIGRRFGLTQLIMCVKFASGMTYQVPFLVPCLVVL